MLSSLTLLTEFLTAAHIEAAAWRTGFVKRASKITGKLFLALVTFGVWSDATTSLAQLAAQVTQLDDQREVSPGAIYQRMHKSTLAFLQELIRQALAKVQALEHGRDEGLFPAFPKVYLAESTGFELPNSLHDRFPGSGGSPRLDTILSYTSKSCPQLLGILEALKRRPSARRDKTYLF